MSFNNSLTIEGLDQRLRIDSPPKRINSNAFQKLMEENLRSESEAPKPSTTPVSREQLVDMLHNITIQMDARMMQAFTSGESIAVEDVYPRLQYPGLADRSMMPPPGSPGKQPIDQNLIDHSLSSSPDSSNKQPVDQNIDMPDPRNRIENAIREAAQTHGVDPALIRSVIKAESNFNPNSTSPKGAMGLMQLMPETARELGVRNGYDPVENIEAGTRYLKRLLTRYDGDIPLALAAYNWGMGNLEKRAGKMPAETRRYVDQVTRQYAALKA